ncbi:MAG: hypothetical protein ACJ8J7_13250, partial [Sulfurifustaceae bacterium]
RPCTSPERGGGIGRGAFQIRELKSYVKEVERREQERSDQVKALKKGFDEWKSDPQLDSFRRNEPHEDDK